MGEQDEKYMNNKKKALSYEGAQYRRVRKMAEQFNQKNHSVNKVSFVGDGDELIKGLTGMNNLVAIERLHPKNKATNFFPMTCASYKNRKMSTELSFRRNRKQETSLPFQTNSGLELEVKCLGKHLL